MKDPFPDDLPHDKHRAHALLMLGRIFSKHPDCDRNAVVHCLEHWLRVQATLCAINGHIREMGAESDRLVKAAAALAEDQYGLTEAVLAAACRRN